MSFYSSAVSEDVCRRPVVSSNGWMQSNECRARVARVKTTADDSDRKRMEALEQLLRGAKVGTSGSV